MSAFQRFRSRRDTTAPDPGTTICMICPTLDERPTGPSAGVLARARLFDRLHLLSIVFVTDPQPNLEETVASLRASGAMPATTVVKSFYQGELSADPGQTSPAPDVRKDEPGFLVVPDATSPETMFRCFTTDGRPAKYKRFSGDRLVIVDHWDGAMRRTRREDYDAAGRVLRVQHFSEDTDRACAEEFRRVDGSTRTTLRLDEESGEVLEILVHGSDGTRATDLDRARTAWIDEELAGLSRPVVFSEHRVKGDPLLLGLRRAARKVAVLHNNHFNAPYDGSNGVRQSFHQLFERAGDLDAVVVLTEEQYDDLRRDFPEVPFHLVPPAPSDRLGPEPEPRDGRLVVAPVPLLDRYAVRDCVTAFATALGSVPDARLEIYGEGKKRVDVVTQIEELGLGDRVTVRGSSAFDLAVLERAACTLVASDNDGLFQPLLDSLAVGTPIVTYDAKYGPRDLLRSRRDGVRTIERGPAAIAAALVAVLTGLATDRACRSRASSAARRFPRERHEAAWVGVLA